MSSIAVSLPLAIDSGDGFKMIKTIKSLVKQNLKMLLLTDPGERVMEPEFGVGLRRYLFLNFDQSIYAEIETNIKKQVATYIPIVTIKRIVFDTSAQDANKLGFSLEYSIPNIGIRDLLEFTI
jgi:phage baseplate assembly protein W